MKTMICVGLCKVDWIRICASRMTTSIKLLSRDTPETRGKPHSWLNTGLMNFKLSESLQQKKGR
jgi:hypothetical protein